MDTNELARELGRRYREAEDKQTVVAIHLFGIEFADMLAGQNLQELCRLAGIPKSYGTELRKGHNLSPFVTLKR